METGLMADKGANGKGVEMASHRAGSIRHRSVAMAALLPPPMAGEAAVITEGAVTVTALLLHIR